MKITNDEMFIKGVENLIDPAEVSELYVYQKLKKLLPRFFFKRQLLKASRQTPYMGFVIEPYSLFLFFRLKNLEKAQALLPDRYELVKAKICADEEPDFYYGTGIFNTRATTFWGTRQESYLIAQDKQTGLLSWIFIDVLSNTIIAMPSSGIADPNSQGALYTTNSQGELFLDFKEDKTNRQLALKGKIVNGKLRELDQDLWLMGNTSIAHSKKLMDRDDSPFAVIFDPAEVKTALELPVNDIDISINTLFPDLAEAELSKALCFPYAQHYLADSPGCRTYVKNHDDMVRIYNELGDLKGIKTFSPRMIKNQLLAGIVALALVITALHIFVF